MPAFYSKSDSLKAMVDETVGRVLDMFAVMPKAFISLGRAYKWPWPCRQSAAAMAFADGGKKPLDIIGGQFQLLIRFGF